MFSKKIRNSSLLLTASLLFASGCAGADTEYSPQMTENTQPDIVTDDAMNIYVDDELPSLDYGGDTFTIFVQDYGGYSAVDFYNETQTGDIVNDAIFERNAKVSERLNIKLDWISYTHNWDDRAEYLNLVRSTVMSGAAEYDLICGLGYFIPGFVTDGILIDMSALPYIDIDKPWWAKEFMKNAAVDDKYYFVTGDASLGLIKNMFCVFMNTELLETLNISENPYELVYNGAWTLDKLFEISSAQYSDLNGNTAIDSDDQFGLLLNSGNHITGFIEALDVDIVSFEADSPEFVFGNEHNVEVVQKLQEAVSNGEGIYFDSKGEAETAYNSIFRNGNVLFATGWLMHTDSYRDLDFEYGVLPYPKWNDTQDEYKTTVLTSYSVLSIPSDCTDTDRAAAVIEALGSESYRTVTPAYFETALKVKYAQDTDTANMFDLIKSGISFDFGYIYTMALDGISDQFKGCVLSGNQSWASKTAALQSSTEIKLTELVNSMRDIAK